MDNINNLLILSEYIKELKHENELFYTKDIQWRIKIILCSKH